ncbi:hypothetical protein G7Y79_00042g078420 [Physcia stellaris]|nr:hypothetical protein G7Y79_00042g078420 [Physcia stellaris]
MKLLKPGGYIQWNETDPSSASIDANALASGNASATQKMLNFMQSPEIAKSTNCISELPSILSSNDFESVIYDRARIDFADRAAWNIGFLLTYEDAMIKAERLEAMELKIVLEKLHGEMCQGSFVQPEIMLAVARKL